LRGSLQKKILRRPISNGRGTQIYMGEVPEPDAPEVFRRIATAVGGNNGGWLDHLTEARSVPQTVRKALVDSRVGQGLFRQKLLAMWSYTCCATGVKTEALLRASHIHPWSLSNDRERLDPFNGLLLTAAYDAAFDAGLVTLEDDGHWLRAPGFSVGECERAGLGNLEERRIVGLTAEHLVYIRRHRTRTFNQ
jgi:putative restriction endonuclease